MPNLTFKSNQAFSSMHFKLIEICIWIHLLKMYLDQIQDFSSNWLHSIQCKKTFKGQIPRTKNFLLSPVKFFQAPFYTSTLSHTNLAILSSKYLLNKEKIGPFFVYGSLKWRYVVKINMTTTTFFLTLRKLFGGRKRALLSIFFRWLTGSFTYGEF